MLFKLSIVLCRFFLVICFPFYMLQPLSVTDRLTKMRAFSLAVEYMLQCFIPIG